MKGRVISKEFSRIAWVKDNTGAEYSCYIDENREIDRKEDLSQNEQNSCVNLNTVFGDSW